ncbi:MAG: DUF5665 domain-containing protein, partial [Candidatus Margulisbacteria bacterium]|nr:DUF5665 domain-containing protein [Candidatus Margulisiibacteriota bacterium]
VSGFLAGRNIMTEEDRLLAALEQVRRDKHQPWRYISFTFLNGIAQGVGFALGTTIVLGIVIYFLTIILAKLVNFPVLGYYFGEISRIIDAYIQHAPKVR